ncbi:MAG: hypothetical protein E7660_06590 [Ruminococcaceae bacterium]|nr:hypothetical protein [Oscillospiraceae bacterium]
MKTVLYADILFLINFSMDFISLYLTFRLVGRRFTAFRGTVAAAVGALSAVIMTYFGVSGILSFIISFVVSFLMILICIGLGFSVKVYLKNTVFLWGIGALLAGAVTFVCSLGGGEIPTFRNNGGGAVFVFAVGALLARWILKIMGSAPKSRECYLDICCFGIKVEASALVDTGNLITEPVSGLPVIFVRKALFSGCADAELLCGEVSDAEKLSPDTRRRVRVVSVRRVGEAKLLWGIVTGGIFLKTKKGRGKPIRAVMVIEDVDGYGGFDCIVPQSVIT